MPNVGGVKYPYTKKGKAAAAKAKGKMKPKAKPRKGKQYAGKKRFEISARWRV